MFIKTKVKTSSFPDSFFKVGELVEGEVIEHNQKNKAVFLDLGKATGVIFGREYLEARNQLKKVKVGDRLRAEVVGLDGEDGYIELSMRGAEEEVKKNFIKEVMAKGEILEGEVVGLNRGGLVVQLKDFSGFLPTSQMKKEHFPVGKTDEEILSQLKKLLGEVVKVKIFSYSPKQNRILLTERIK